MELLLGWGWGRFTSRRACYSRASSSDGRQSTIRRVGSMGSERCNTL
jgi:hypothetical protein